MSNIRDLIGLNTTKGDVGLEIEVEGYNMPNTNATSAFWRVEHDGSLRGEEAREFVMQRPLPIGELHLALTELDDAFTRYSSRVDDSIRAGVHCHINVQELTVKQMINFAVAYYVLEEVLVDYCGEHRVGNHFCLRAKDAEYIIGALAEVARDRTLRPLNSDNLRYASLNYRSLFRYGSLEFRSMGTSRDLSRIKVWAETLYNIKEVAIKYENPQDIITSISGDGIIDFCRHLLGEHHAQFITDERCSPKLMGGMRIAQEVAYSTDWGTQQTNNNIWDNRGGVF